MTKLFAQPYDLSADGFYFDTVAEYFAKAMKLKNHYGQPVEEFEIQFIDGEGIDCQLFEALSIHQGDAGHYLEAVENWTDDQKIKVIIAVGEVGYKFDLANDDPDQFDVDLYDCNTMRDLAEQFVEVGLYGDIPDSVRFYLDYDAIARDLSMNNYGQTTIDRQNYIYRCD